MIDGGQLQRMYIPHLRTQFSRANVVLFTGAGFSLSAANHRGEKLPTVSRLAEALWTICYPGEEMDPSEQLQDVYEAALQADANGTETLLRRLFTVDVKKCPEHYRQILTMPWRQIYTLNVDDLSEKVLESHQRLRRIRSVSASAGRVPSSTPDYINVMHVNGSLDDVPKRITFSRSQYASRSSTDSFYSSLRQELIARPVVFLGSSLDEGPLWQHLSMRGSKPDKEFRPRSYLVTPSLPKTRQALLSQYNIVWLPYTAEEFAESLLPRMAKARVEGLAYLRTRQEQRKSGGVEILRISDIEEGTKEPTEYLFGAEPQWVDATRKRIADRDCFDEISDAIDGLRTKSRHKGFVIVTGTAGTGKSSAMMSIALRKEAEGVPSAWIEAGGNNQNVHAVRRALERDRGLRLVFIADADLWGRRLSQLVKDLADSNPLLIVVCECRSTKVDRIVDRYELGLIEPIEFTIPRLGDNDIEAILDVLDRENRLGKLKGMTRGQRRTVFEAEAGRQMLVAMYKATHGVDFRERAEDELNEMSLVPKYLYGIISVAHAHRFMLSRDELAIACGDDIEEWPRALNNLVRRGVVMTGRSETFRARHREIAQFIYNGLANHGTFVDIVESLIKIAGTRSHINMKPYERPKRMLSTFINHNLIQRSIGVAVGRRTYSKFETLLSWDHHYWLHRGALELENNQLGLAENFLRTAESLAPNDVFIQNELAYLMLKKANSAPRDLESVQMVEDALAILKGVVQRRPDQRAHAAHIAGSQGLIWSRVSDMGDRTKQQFLEALLTDVEDALPYDTEDMLAMLQRELKAELLSIAVRPAK